jgi:hypothetical protein
VELHFRGGLLDGQVRTTVHYLVTESGLSGVGRRDAPAEWVENLEGFAMHYRRVGEVTDARAYYELPRLSPEEYPVVKRAAAELERTLRSVPPEQRTADVWPMLEAMDAYARAVVEWTEHDVSDPGITL